MTYTLFVPGPLPGMNEIVGAAKGFGGRGYGYAKMKAKWTDTIALLAKAAKIPPIVRARFAFTWHETTRRRNPDNIAAGGKKFVFDGLVSAGVLPNDGWTEIESWTDTFVAGSKRPGVEVTILTLQIQREVP